MKYKVTGYINFAQQSYWISKNVQADNKSQAIRKAFAELKKDKNFKTVPEGVLYNKVKVLHVFKL